jgi:peptidoglycan/xylan/chitin deacetylase (PgdA/CDA1 family)
MTTERTPRGRRGRRALVFFACLALAGSAAATAHAAVGDELLTNPGAESGTAGWTQNQWGSMNAAFSQPSTAHAGGRSFRVDASGWSSGDAKWVPDIVPVVGGQTYRISDWYMSNATTSYAVYWENSSGVGSWMNLDNVAPATSWTAHNLTVVMPPTAVRAFPVHLIAANGYLQTDDYSMTQVAPQAGFQRGIVSLSFDDSLSSQWNNAFSPTGYLAAYGFRGTEYVITSSIGQSGSWTQAQIKDADLRGQDIESHTVTHSDLTTLLPSQLTTELQQSQSTLQTLLGHSVASSIAYPYGAYTDTTLAQVVKYYGAGRSVEPGYNTKSSTPLYHLQVQNIEKTTTAADVQSWVNLAKANNYWLILVYHGIDTSGSEYSTTPASFDQQLANIRNSGLVVESVKDALQEVRPQIGAPAPPPPPPPPPVDTTPPSITIVTPAKDATYTWKSRLLAGYSCADASGIASCTGTVPNGGAINTKTRGSHTFTVNARDPAGNTSRQSVIYTVR